MASTTSPTLPAGTLRPQRSDASRPDSMIRRSWHAMAELFSPFSSAALASLPSLRRPVRYTRADAIPDTERDEDGQEQPPHVRDYHAINSVRVPKKIATPVRVEGKVWFANERTWISWLNTSVMMVALSVAMFNASKDQVARNFAYTYAFISIGIMIYGYLLYQKRITMIRRRDPGHFDQIAGPVVVTVLLFCAILTNFVIRVRELREKNIPIPGTDSFQRILRAF